MNIPNQSPAITKSKLDRLHETATRYKQTAKVIVIISYIVLLLGLTGVFSLFSIPFGFIFAGAPFAGAFIFYLLLQIPVLILTAKANHIFAITSPTYAAEHRKEAAKNILMYKILFAFITVVVFVFLAVIFSGAA